MRSWSQPGMSRDHRQPFHFKICFCFGRKFAFLEVRPPSDVQQLFERYSENGTMTIDHLHRFLVDYQMEKDATREDAMSVLHSLRHHIMYRKELNLDHFFRYLLSDQNPPVLPSLGVISHYIYILSSASSDNERYWTGLSPLNCFFYKFKLAATCVSWLKHWTGLFTLVFHRPDNANVVSLYFRCTMTWMLPLLITICIQATTPI